MTTRGTVGGNETPAEIEPAFQPTDQAASMVRRGRAAEAQLYPLIIVDPDRYEAAITVVGEAADVLRRQCDTPSDLIDVDPEDVLAQCRSAGALPAFGLEPTTVLEAAWAQRWRELTTKQPDNVEADQADGGDR